jgi:hypothetical protein
MYQVADFFTPECYTCKTLYPKLKQIASDNPDVIFTKVGGVTLLLLRKSSPWLGPPTVLR